jgi:hypothetical protein
MGDANLKIRTPRGIAHLTSMGIRDVVQPFILNDADFSTYDRGSTIIDGIFTLGDIEVKAGGYLPFGK